MKTRQNAGTVPENKSGAECGRAESTRGGGESQDDADAPSDGAHGVAYGYPSCQISDSTKLIFLRKRHPPPRYLRICSGMLKYLIMYCIRVSYQATLSPLALPAYFRSMPALPWYSIRVIEQRNMVINRRHFGILSFSLFPSSEDGISDSKKIVIKVNLASFVDENQFNRLSPMENLRRSPITSRSPTRWTHAVRWRNRCADR